LVPKMMNPELMPAEWRALSKFEMNRATVNSSATRMKKMPSKILKGLRALPTLVQQFLSAISRCLLLRCRTCSLPSSSCRLCLSLEERGRPSIHLDFSFSI
ncbi:hypothetical protein T07_13625, partial [Trichinella nelsoni]